MRSGVVGLGCIAAKTSAPVTPLGYRRNGRAIWPIEGQALAVNCFNVTNDTDDVDRSSYTTASVTLLAANAYLLSVITSHATAAPIPTVAGASQTWVQVDSQTFAGGQGRLTTFRCGGLAGSGTLTITATAATGCQWILDGFTGAITDNNGGGAIFQEVGSNGTATTATATLGTTEPSATANASYGVWARSGAANEAWTPGTGFTSIVQTGGATPARSFLTEFSATLDTTVDASWTTSATYRAFAFEIRFLDPSKVYMTPLTSGISTTAATSFNTATIKPDSNRLILLGVYAHKSTATVSTPTASGCGVTWVQVATTVGFPTANAFNRVTLFRAMGTPTSGAITISLGGVSHTACAWSVTEYGNVDTGGANGANAIVQSLAGSSDATVTTATITLGAFGSIYNATFGVIGTSSATAAFVPGTGFTEIHDQEATAGGTASGAVETEWRPDNDTTVDWTFASNTYGAVACEIKYAPQPKPIVPPVPREALMRSVTW